MINNITTIDGKLYAEVVRRAAYNLGLQKNAINDLNVFPIPDGDTGDNMYMTMMAGAGVSAEESISDVSEAVSRQMLYSARGNSGVILSRIFNGIAKGFNEKKTAGIPELKYAMSLGVREAYSAVETPVEGTMLTVLRDAVNEAESCDDSATIIDYFNILLPAMRRSLERTPEQLAVLRDAGVVDSGGAGLVAITEGLLQQDVKAPEEAGGTSAKSLDYSLFGPDTELEYGYCTEFLLRLQNSKVDVDTFDETVLTDWLTSNGESVVAFREDSIIKVHVHTRTPGDILTHCQKYGEFLSVKVENMTLQHNGKENRPSRKKTVPHKKYATVAVASGEGMKKMFEELGVDAVIYGGQSNNPSTEDFIRAFGTVSADNILVFPNNGNIIMAAEQAAGLWKESNVTVIRSKSIGEGYIALSTLDTTDRTPDEITASLYDEMKRVKTGVISRATKNADFGGITVNTGNYIGFSGHNVLSSADTPLGAAEALCRTLDIGECGLCIIITGDGADSEEARKIADHVEHTYPVEAIVTDGGQPVYDYILIFD